MRDELSSLSSSTKGRSRGTAVNSYPDGVLQDVGLKARLGKTDCVLQDAWPKDGCAALEMNVVRIWPSPSTDTSVQAGWQSYGLAGLEHVKLGDGWRHRPSGQQHRDTLLRQHRVDETLDVDCC
jgi:hypothetical protein